MAHASRARRTFVWLVAAALPALAPWATPARASAPLDPCALLHGATAGELLGVPLRHPPSSVRYLVQHRTDGWTSCVARVAGNERELALSIATTSTLRAAEHDTTSAAYDFFCRSMPQAMRLAIAVDEPPRIPRLGQWAFNSMLGVYILAGDTELLVFAGSGGLSKVEHANIGGVAFNDLTATTTLAKAALARSGASGHAAHVARPKCG